MKSNYPVFSPLQLNTLLHNTTGNCKPAGKSQWFINGCIFAVLLLMPFFSGATVVYVTPTGAGNHNGLSWANACTLNQAAIDWFTCQLDGTQGCAQGIADCGDHDSIWMSKGTHTAIVGSFGVTFFFNVYGGFNGNETSFSQRNPALYVTKILGPGKFLGSTIPVQTGNPCSSAYMDGSATVDGIEFDSCLVSSFIQLNANNCTFAGCLLSLSNNISATHCNFQNGGTVEFLGDGYETSGSFSNCNFSYLGGTSGEVNSAVSSGLLISANFSSCTFDHNTGTMGGAIDAGDIILTTNHCTFTNNTSIGNPGGAIYAAQYLTVTNSTFSNNTATAGAGGGAIYYVQYGATITSCSFTSNSSPGGDAGAVYAGADDGALSKDTFSTNSAVDGGAVFLSGRTTVYYSVFESNTATATGGAIALGGANSYIESCLLVANSAQGQGGGGGIGGMATGNAYNNIYNNTFVNNIGPGGSALADNGGSSNIENNILWATNTQLYPLFEAYTNSSSYSNNMSIDGSLGTEANPLLNPNYTLASCSPAINVGDNGMYEGQTVTDLAGNPRIYGGTVDLGCYEYQGKKTVDTAQVSITSNQGNSICAAYPVTFTATPVNGGTAPSYQWKKNGVNAGSNSATYNAGTLNANDSVECIMTSSDLCAVVPAVTSNTMKVLPALIPSLTVSANPSGAVCQGSAQTFTASPVNGGSSPSYQWLLNNVDVGNTSGTYTDNSMKPNDVIKCVMESDYFCLTTSQATNSISPQVNATVVPAVSISANPGSTICAVTSVTFTASPTNGGSTPAYLWKKNGNVVGSNSNQYTDNGLNNNDIVTCELTSNVNCASPTTATSSNIKMTVNPLLTPSVGTATSTGTTICQGADASFEAQPINGGTAPAYQWYLNGNPSGTNSATYSSFTFNNNDVLYCVMTSNATCASPATANSDTITMTVNPLLTPSVSIAITNGAQNICTGTPVTFTATPVNAGTNIAYTFYVNGNFAQFGSSTTYTSTTLNNNDSVTCKLTIENNNLCVTTKTATSSSITITVNPILTPSVSIGITGGAQTICAGSSVTFTAIPVNGGTNPDYNFMVNGNSVQDGSAGTFTSASLNNGDVVSCILTSNATCISTATATSDSITMTVNPLLATSAGLATLTGNTICAGSDASFEAQPINGGAAPVYQWYLNGNPSGTNSATYNSNTFNNGDMLYCVMTSNATCARPATANTDTITMTVNPLLTPSVSIAITGGAQTTCVGTPITFTATPVNAGTNLLYFFKVNGGFGQIGASPIFTTSSLNNNDSVSCVTTIENNHLCITTQTATSNSITMTVGIPPVLTCPGPVTLNADSGLCASSASIGMATSTGGCGNVTITANPAGPYPVGTTTVEWTAVDQFGDSSSCNQTVIVVDSQLPTIICPATVNVNTDAGQCSASNVSLGTPVTGDNCGVASISNNVPSIYPVGNTTVTWTVTDIHGNSTTCNQTVTVTDNQLPTIICPGTVSVYADAGLCSASNVSLGTPVTGDNCGVASVSNNAPSTYAVGNTTVTWTVTDIHGNSATCNQTVTVTDNQLPTIICPGTVSVYADAELCSASNVSLGTPVTGDNCGVASVSNNAPSTYAVGNTTVTWTVTDIHGNNATCNQTVTVTDNQLPTIICPRTVSVYADAGLCSASNVSLGTPVTGDNCGVASVSNNAPSTYAVGNTTVTWTVTDIHGNSATCNQTVTVTDNQLPTIICPATVNVFADAGICSASHVGLGTPVTGDNCGVASVTNNAPAIYPVGNTTVTWTVTDIHGNINTCNQTVTVTDNQVPVITCPAGIAITANQTSYNKPLTITAPVATDNCGIASVKNSFNGAANASGTYAVGTTDVLWTATDIHGNTGTCTQVVTIYPCMAITASVANTICLGTDNGSISLAVTGGNGTYTYHWSNGQTTATAINLAANTYTVTVNDQAQGTATATFTVGTTVPAAKPATPGAISGLAAFCSNATNTYSIAVVPYTASYTWSVPNNATIQSGQGTNQITVKFASAFSSGTISVLATNCKGSSNKSNLSVSLFAIPSRPASIAGATPVCIGSTQSYTVAAVTGASSYTWTVPAHTTITSGQGTATLTVQYQTGFTGGNIGVYASNCISNGSTLNLYISPETAPAEPGSISGTASICPNVTYEYLISSVTNATSYTWTVPANATILSGQGTTTLTVEYTSAFTGGSLSVYASDCAGNSAARNLSISLEPVPTEPSAIFGTMSVCPNDVYQYSVNSVTNATSYTWTVPANATIQSGQGTSSIKVEFTSAFSSGSISVYASDCAGNGHAQTGTVTKATRGCGTAKMDDDTSGGRVSGVDEQTDPSFEVKLYPNPFASQFHLGITSPSTTPVTLSIYTMTGQLIEEKREAFTGTDIIMGNSLANGVYLIQIKQDDKTKVLRFIKSE